ncbi:MAG: GH92 family glycosyl hydrolase [Muribaculaceae bacterium]
MINKRICAAVVAAALCGCSLWAKDAVDYVNPIIGASTSTSAGKSGHGLGKTFPGVTTPFGLVQLSPDTKTGGDNGPGYSWHHTTIEGFSFVHMSGIGWYGDFGNFLVTPTVGKLHTYVGREKEPETGYRSRYSHDTEVARAGYYAVTLDDYNIRTELTCARRSGMLRFTFPQSETSRISIDLARRIGGSATEQYVKVVNSTTIEGWMRCTPADGGWGNGDGNVGYTVYFSCCFSRPLKQYGMWDAHLPESIKGVRLQTLGDEKYIEAVKNAEVLRGCNELRGRHIGFFTEFPTVEGEQVLMKVGISFVSIDGARRNLAADIDHWSFEEVYAANRSLWQDALGCIDVEGSDHDKTIFYTALYHTMIDPRDVSDVTGEYVGGDGKVQRNTEFTYRTIFSGWDVFRSQFPLQTIVNPCLVNDEINSLISLADLSGRKYYPRWEIMNSYSGCMLGNPAVSVITDAYAKGIREYDVAKAYDYCENSVENTGNGRLIGYTPLDISRTLEYAYGDWCVARFAKLLGKDDKHKRYLRYSRDYRNIWNDSVKWFCGRDKNGKFGAWRGETVQDQYCTESNPLQQGWFVPHDVYGFMSLLGKDRFTKKLTEFFDRSSSDFLWNDYYNHPNEPVHHVPFMFNYTGKAWLTQKWTRRICSVAYGTDVMGLCGNEDVGQMSAWYVLAASGFHPVCPGDNMYMLTSPVFNKVTIHLDEHFYGGGDFVIEAKNNSPENVYIQSATLNGKPLNRAWITHSEVVSGGVLQLVMGNKPNEKFGSKQLPPSVMK